MSRPVRDDRGSVTAFVVLMVVVLFVVMGLVVDGGAALSAQQAAADEAEQAARAGAGMLSVSALRQGVLQLDAPVAVGAAEAFTRTAGHPGVATVAPDGVVTVTVSYRIPTAILGMVHITSLPVSATASAEDVQGVTEATP
jgi:Flp pilus assembly protein TadG